MTRAGRAKGLLIVGIGGAARPASSSERAVRFVLEQAAQEGAEVLMHGGRDLAGLPHFAPHESARSPEQRALVEAVRRADGIVLGTPGYHGGISGLVKNALDLMEDLRSDGRPYFDGRAVGCIVTAGGDQAGGMTLQALRGVVHALRGWPTPLGLCFNTALQDPFDADGHPHAAAAQALWTLADQVLRFATVMPAVS